MFIDPYAGIEVAAGTVADFIRRHQIDPLTTKADELSWLISVEEQDREVCDTTAEEAAALGWDAFDGQTPEEFLAQHSAARLQTGQTPTPEQLSQWDARVEEMAF